MNEHSIGKAKLTSFITDWNHKDEAEGSRLKLDFPYNHLQLRLNLKPNIGKIQKHEWEALSSLVQESSGKAIRFITEEEFVNLSDLYSEETNSPRKLFYKKGLVLCVVDFAKFAGTSIKKIENCLDELAEKYTIC